MDSTPKACQGPFSLFSYRAPVLPQNSALFVIRSSHFSCRPHGSRMRVDGDGPMLQPRGARAEDYPDGSAGHRGGDAVVTRTWA